MHNDDKTLLISEFKNRFDCSFKLETHGGGSMVLNYHINQQYSVKVPTYRIQCRVELISKEQRFT